MCEATTEVVGFLFLCLFVFCLFWGVFFCFLFVCLFIVVFGGGVCVCGGGGGGVCVGFKNNVLRNISLERLPTVSASLIFMNGSLIFMNTHE